MEKKDDVFVLTEMESTGVAVLVLIGAFTAIAGVGIAAYKTFVFVGLKAIDVMDKRARKKAIQKVVETTKGES